MPRTSQRWPRRIALVLSVVFILCTGPLGHTQDDAPPTEQLAVAQLIELALEDNPELASQHDRWSAALLRAGAARSSLPQPRLTYRAYLLAIETRQGPQRHLVTLSQAFPWFRALRDQADPHLADAERLAAEFDSSVLDVVYRLESAVIELSRLDAVATTIREQRLLYQDVADHQSAVMPFGGAEHADLLRTTLMIEVLTDRVLDLDRQSDLQLAAIREETRVRTLEREDIAVVDAANYEAVAAFDELLAAAGRNPQFAALDARRAAAFERAQASASRALPMPTVSVSWGVIGRYETPLPNSGRGGDDVFSLGLSVPIPVFREQYDSGSEAFEAEVEALIDDEVALRWELRGQLERSLIRVAEEEERIARYERDLLPTVRDIAEHYTLTVAQGGTNHTEYLLAFEQELQMELAVVNARFAIEEEMARIRRVTAVALESPTSDELPRITEEL